MPAYSATASFAAFFSRKYLENRKATTSNETLKYMSTNGGACFPRAPLRPSSWPAEEQRVLPEILPAARMLASSLALFHLQHRLFLLSPLAQPSLQNLSRGLGYLQAPPATWTQFIFLSIIPTLLSEQSGQLFPCFLSFSFLFFSFLFFWFLLICFEIWLVQLLIFSSELPKGAPFRTEESGRLGLKCRAMGDAKIMPSTCEKHSTKSGWILFRMENLGKIQLKNLFFHFSGEEKERRRGGRHSTADEACRRYVTGGVVKGGVETGGGW